MPPWPAFCLEYEHQIEAFYTDQVMFPLQETYFGFSFLKNVSMLPIMASFSDSLRLTETRSLIPDYTVESQCLTGSRDFMVSSVTYSAAGLMLSPSTSSLRSVCELFCNLVLQLCCDGQSTDPSWERRTGFQIQLNITS